MYRTKNLANRCSTLHLSPRIVPYYCLHGVQKSKFQMENHSVSETKTTHQECAYSQHYISAERLYFLCGISVSFNHKKQGQCGGQSSGPYLALLGANPRRCCSPTHLVLQFNGTWMFHLVECSSKCSKNPNVAPDAPLNPIKLALHKFHSRG